VVAGPGHLDLWLRSTAVDADLEVVMTEVYPDGQEVEVQEGLLRAGDRSVDASRARRGRSRRTPPRGRRPGTARPCR